MDNKFKNNNIVPSPLHSEIQRYHNNQIKERSKDERSSFSPPVYKRSTSRSNMVQEEVRQAFSKTGTETLETAKKLNSERNIVEEYRQKIKAKLSESASFHLQNQSMTAFHNHRTSSGLGATAGPSVLSTLNHSQYNPLRLSPPRQDTLLTKQALYEPDPIDKYNSKQPSPIHFSYQPTPEDQKLTSGNIGKQQYDPLRSRYSDHVNVMNTKSGQQTRSISKESHSPAPKPYEQTNNYQPTSSFSETNPLHYNSTTNPLQISSNGLKMSDSSMQSVYHRIQNLRKAIQTQDSSTPNTQVKVSSKEIQPYRATPSPKPDLLEQFNQAQHTLQVELSPQMHSIVDSASGTNTHHRRSLGIDGSSIEHKRKRSYNSNDKDLEFKLRNEMEAKFQERMGQIEELNKHKNDAQYQDLLSKFNSLLFQFNQVTKQAQSKQKFQSRNQSQEQSRSHEVSKQSNNKDIESSVTLKKQSVDKKPVTLTTYSEEEVSQSKHKANRSTSVRKIQSIVSLGIPKSMSSRSNKSSSICPIRSRNELFTMQEVASRAREASKPTLSFSKAPKEKSQRQTLHKKKFKYRGSEKVDLKKIDYPSLDKVNYFAHKQSQETKREKEKDKTAFNIKRMISDFQKQVISLQSEKTKLQREVAQLQSRLLADGGEVCCCVELKQIHDEERKHMETIVDMWRQKASATAEYYQLKVSEVKGDIQHLQKDCTQQIKKMEEQQAYTMNMIIDKQQHIELEYHRKLQKSEKENRDLNRRVVEHRHALVQQRLNDL